MKIYYCDACGTKIFTEEDSIGKKTLLSIPGYTCEAYVLSPETNLSTLKHRTDPELQEVWSCCRIMVMRPAGGTPPAMLAYADALLELSEGTPLPPLNPPQHSRHLNADNFDAAIATGALPENATRLYVVKFTALWCPPCRAMDYVFKKISQTGDFPELVFLEVDADVEQDLADKYNCPSLPYILFFKNGRQIDISRLTLQAFQGGLNGALPEQEFRALCHALLLE